jgi:dienelactone hydrolase
MSRLKIVLLGVLVIALSACVGVGNERPSASTDTIVAQAARLGFVRSIVDTPLVPIAIWHRGTHGPAGTHVYIEGDGQAWASSSQPSGDPTPRNPVSLRLAVRDPGPSVLYISRPCQYLAAQFSSRCSNIYWTSHRYSREVVKAIQQVINRITAHGRSAPIGLIGYSGGGALAALIAAERDDVAWLVTVAANLDTDAWTTHHRVTPLDGSLNPLQVAPYLTTVPQLHLMGGEDRTVPRDVNQRFFSAVGLATNRVRSIDQYSHSCCWDSSWPRIACSSAPPAFRRSSSLCSP